MVTNKRKSSTEGITMKDVVSDVDGLADNLNEVEHRLRRLERSHDNLKDEVGFQFWAFGAAAVISFLSIKGLTYTQNNLSNQVEKLVQEGRDIPSRVEYEIHKHGLSNRQ